MMLEQQIGVEQQVIEVEGVCGLQAALVFGIHARHDLRHRILRLRSELLRDNQMVLRIGNAAANELVGETLRVYLKHIHDLFNQPLGIVGVVNGEVAREAKHLGIGTQNAHAHAMEGRNPHAACRAAHEALQTLAHFAGGLVCEGDGENLPRRGAAVLQQVGNTIG